MTVQISKETTPRLLIVDDDEIYCSVLSDAIIKRGYLVKYALNQQQALSIAEEFKPTYVVVDLRLGDESGLHLIKRLKEEDATREIVMLTGYASIATAVEAVKLGATQYITKPTNADEILDAFTIKDTNYESLKKEQPLSVKRLEWEHLQKVLLENDGNISEAARQLNMHRRTLQRKLAKRPVKS
jgi:two-component system response regulator RegA